MKYEKWIVADTDTLFEYQLTQSISMKYFYCSEMIKSAWVKKRCKPAQSTEIFALFMFGYYNTAIGE